jgi:hypothetical protein
LLDISLDFYAGRSVCGGFEGRFRQAPPPFALPDSRGLLQWQHVMLSL